MIVWTPTVFECLICMRFLFLHMHLFSAIEHVSSGKLLEKYAIIIIIIIIINSAWVVLWCWQADNRTPVCSTLRKHVVAGWLPNVRQQKTCLLSAQKTCCWLVACLLDVRQVKTCLLSGQKTSSCCCCLVACITSDNRTSACSVLIKHVVAG